ncbi:MAG TPA: DNA (cytosine-5-)-methyltransferase [Clostridiales bacterium]|nr:DNA (cytosine-5-)-methyltransferase [Clostridiales bacterium]
MELTHLSLFSGIGGLDLAAEWAGFKTVGQCEWADYPTKVLEKHWPDVPRWRDIHELSADDFYRRSGIERGHLTVISGGFPCQPHSLAGLRKASNDERDLWPEYRRAIGEIRPKWVVAENVRGLLTSEDGRFFRGILRDFADLGYDVGWCCYRAADVGAVHARERVAIIANTSSQRLQREREKQIYRINSQEPNRYIFSVEEWRERSNLFEPKLLRNYHGLPGSVDRIKSLGNSVVPMQFYPIFKAIADIEAMIPNNN